jgi:hypothetical protein
MAAVFCFGKSFAFPLQGKTETVFHEKAVDVNQNSFFALFVGWMFLLAGGAYSKTGYLASIRTLMGVFAPGARL